MSIVGSLISDVWDSFKIGELVFIERRDNKDHYFGLWHLISWGISKGYTVLIVDVLDALHMEISKSKLAGMKTPSVNEIYVIKLGGTSEDGKLVRRIADVTEPVITAKKFKDAYEDFLNEKAPVLTVTIGLERLLSIVEPQPKNVVALIDLMARYVGDERRLAVQLIKTNILGDQRNSVLQLLEDTATTVIEMEKKGKTTEIRITKSINPNLEGVVIRV